LVGGGVAGSTAEGAWELELTGALSGSWATPATDRFASVVIMTRVLFRDFMVHLLLH
jgi:hypothetical protein